MPPAITVDILDRMRPNLVALLTEQAKTLPGMRYCDLRISVREEKGAVAENGNVKASAEVSASRAIQLHLRGWATPTSNSAAWTLSSPKRN